jgi:integral membrane sensor domain MASE1
MKLPFVFFFFVIIVVAAIRFHLFSLSISLISVSCTEKNNAPFAMEEKLLDGMEWQQT